MSTVGIGDTEQMLYEISRSCLPGQFARELVLNSIQAITRSGLGKDILVDEDSLYPGMFSVTDDGPGMSEEMLHSKQPPEMCIQKYAAHQRSNS